MSRLACLSSVLFLLVLVGLEPSLDMAIKVDGECVCPTTAEECHCRFTSMKKVPANVLANCSLSWKSIDFSFNSIQSLNPPGLFKAHRCPSVESLSLFVNGINGSLNTGAFEGLNGLRNLNLSRNKIVTLKGKPFASASQLRTLDLSRNSIRVLSKSTFLGLKQLEVLQLFGNYIGFIEGNAFVPLERLRKLVLAQNNMTQLREVSFKGTNSLVELNLLRNPIKEFQAGVFDNMPNLERLVVGLCGKLIRLRQLKGRLFTKLGKLKEFSLTSCDIKAIDKEAFVGLSGLQTLVLKENAMRRIDRSIWKPLTALKRLDLSQNGLECLVDQNFEGLQSVEEVNLAHNRITYLSDATFRGLTNLQRLVLRNNPLRFVQVDAFCHLTRLTFLSLIDVSARDVVNSDDNNSSLSLAIEALPTTVSVQRPSDGAGLKPRGAGCRVTPAVLTGPPNPVCRSYYSRTLKPNSRQYLLIIIGVCVSFLLMAMAIILSYRAWSKRKRTACEKAEQAALEEEKQEMMEKPTAPAAQANGGSATTELLAAGQSAENGVVLHHPGAQKPGGGQPQTGTETGKGENTMTHLAVV